MLEKIRQTVENKKVLVLGLGREGRSSLRMIRKAGGYKELAVADQNPVEVKESGEEKIPVISGTHYMDKELLDSYDIVFKTPGIVLPEKIENYKCQFVSQTGLFIRKEHHIHSFVSCFEREWRGRRACRKYRYPGV